MKIRIIVILLLVINGCASPGDRETFIEKDIIWTIKEADSYFESGNYQEAKDYYSSALEDLRILITLTDEELKKSTLVLDSLEIYNKLEVAKIGILLK